MRSLSARFGIEQINKFSQGTGSGRPSSRPLAAAAAGQLRSQIIKMSLLDPQTETDALM